MKIASTSRNDASDVTALTFRETAALLAAALFDAGAVVIRLWEHDPVAYIHNTLAGITDGTLLAAVLAHPASGAVRAPVGAAATPTPSLEIQCADMPAGAPICFHARIPLIDSDGVERGAIHLLDDARGEFSAFELTLARRLATHVVEGAHALRSFHFEDRLTRLGNRTRFVLDAEAALARADGVEARLWASIIEALPLADIGQLVVTVGLARVESAIEIIAGRVVRALPSGIRLYRLGLARFGFICDNDLDSVHRCLTDCVTQLDQPIMVDEVLQLDLRVAAGMIPVEQGGIGELVGALFATAQAARAQGRPVSVFNKEVLQKQQRHGLIVNSIRSALASPSQLRLVYQPRERISDGSWTSVEALLRWNHPTLGEVPPGEFIPLIENTALMPILTDWVLDSGLKQLGLWQERMPLLKMSINISASDLKRPGFDARVRRLMDQHGISGRSVELELTEGSIVRADRGVLETLRGLNQHGVDIAIDDFGAGYSNLSQLSELSFDVIKIDNALVRAVMKNQRAGTIVQSVVSLAKQLGHRVVVEGVETAELKDLSVQWGCDEMQGYFIARPMESLAMSQALTRRHPHIHPAAGTAPLAN